METPLQAYLRSNTSPLPDAFDWIVRQTNIRTNYPHMLSGPVQGRFLKMLVEISGARRILEIGTFTGYSSACMALGLPEGGHLDTLEINDEMEDLIREGWRRAGVSEKISLHIGNALETLSGLDGPYDFAFIDADKREYPEYYPAVKPLIRKGGLIVVDDVLWDGKVYEDPAPRDAQTRGLVRLAQTVSSDSEVEQVMLPLRDGLLLLRKL